MVASCIASLLAAPSSYLSTACACKEQAHSKAHGRCPRSFAQHTLPASPHTQPASPHTQSALGCTTPRHGLCLCIRAPERMQHTQRTLALGRFAGRPLLLCWWRVVRGACVLLRASAGALQSAAHARPVAHTVLELILHQAAPSSLPSVGTPLLGWGSAGPGPTLRSASSAHKVESSPPALALLLLCESAGKLDD